MFERCKYANDCDAQCSGAIENSETCDSFQLHQKLEQAVNQYNQVVKQNKDLQTELNTVKQQYNCYACGGCKGKEDYVNLEKHHLGLRKQFDKYNSALNEIENILLWKFGENTSFDFIQRIYTIINSAKGGKNG